MVSELKKAILYLISEILTVSILLNNILISVYASDDLWNKFLKYDLCITNYEALTDEEKELCRFIFDTEQASDDTVICERARRTLAGDSNIGERLTLDVLANCYGIWDNYSGNKSGWTAYTHCVPDIKNLDGWNDYNEYWLDDSGKVKVIYAGENTGVDNTQGKFYVKVTSTEDISEYESFYLENEQIISYYTDSQNKDGTYNLSFAVSRKGEEPVLTYTNINGEHRYVSNEYLEVDGDYYYIKQDNTAVFVKSKYCDQPGYETDAEPIIRPFIIPAEINGSPVTTIAEFAFYNTPFTEIVIPDTVKVIDRYAFNGCDYLTKLNFPKDLEYIGIGAVCLPNEQKLLINCPKLYLDSNSLSGGFTEAEVNVREIGENAFSSSVWLKSIKFGEDVIKINANAFRYCSALESVSIPENVIAIGQGAFSETSLKAVTLVPTVKVLGALPKSKGIPATSGIEYPATHPLTDTPICALESNCVIYGYKGTEAESYAKEWNLEFIELETQTGDINGDGVISVSDIVSVQKALVGTSTTIDFDVIDINCDNKFNVFDLIILKRMAFSDSMLQIN